MTEPSRMSNHWVSARGKQGHYARAFARPARELARRFAAERMGVELSEIA